MGEGVSLATTCGFYASIHYLSLGWPVSEWRRNQSRSFRCRQRSPTSFNWSRSKNPTEGIQLIPSEESQAASRLDSVKSSMHKANRGETLKIPQLSFSLTFFFATFGCVLSLLCCWSGLGATRVNVSGLKLTWRRCTPTPANSIWDSPRPPLPSYGEWLTDIWQNHLPKRYQEWCYPKCA